MGKSYAYKSDCNENQKSDGGCSCATLACHVIERKYERDGKSERNENTLIEGVHCEEIYDLAHRGKSRHCENVFLFVSGITATLCYHVSEDRKGQTSDDAEDRVFWK